MSVCSNKFSKVWLKFLFASGAFALFAVSLSVSWQRFDVAVALAAGFVAGIGDNCIMLRGVEKGAKLSGAMSFVVMKNHLEMVVKM
jgi:hypothetical protein